VSLVIIINTGKMTTMMNPKNRRESILMFINVLVIKDINTCKITVNHNNIRFMNNEYFKVTLMFKCVELLII